MNSSSNHHFNNLRFKVSENMYYDFKLVDNLPEIKSKLESQYFDLDFTSDTDIYNKLIWDKSSVGNDITAIPTFGLTAIDNGSVDLNTDTETTLTESPLTINQEENRFEFKVVNGYRRGLNYSGVSVNTITDEITFNGGFLQGFYKLNGYDYEVLPNRFNKGWTIHTRIKRSGAEAPQDSLNELSTQMGNNTSGYFFYIGTRAENKFWNKFEGLNPEVDNQKEVDYEGVIETVSDEQEFIIPLNPPRMYVRKMDNEFLIYGRSSGRGMCGDVNNDFGFGTKRAGHFEQGDSLYYLTHAKAKKVGEINPFLKYGRSSGRTMCGELTDSQYGTKRAGDDESIYDLSEQLDVNEDIIDNSLGFRITDDGLLGYKRITKNPDCESEEPFIIEERFIPSDVFQVPVDSYINLTLVWKTFEELQVDCVDARDGFLQVFVNGYLIYTFENFKELIPKELNDHKDKQLGVPFNISLGGGTQGLIESLTFDGPDPSDDNLPLATHFAGTFLGSMKGFKMFEEPLDWCDIKKIQ
jgi:hypothetical protein